MRRRVASLVLLLLPALALPEAAYALSGQITHLSGAVVARRADGGSRVLSMRSEVNEGDIVITAGSSYARIKWADGGEVVIRPNTQLKIDAYKYEEGSPQSDNIVLSLLKGGMRSVTGLLGRRNPGAYRVATPNATIGIRGTHFGVLFCNSDCSGITGPGGGPPPNGLHVDVASGTIVLSNAGGSREYSVGEFGFVLNRNTPPAAIPPSEGMRVVLPSQALDRTALGGSVGAGSDLECAIR